MLNAAQLASVEARLRAVEASTGAQVVVAAIDRADVYHGLRWRAFALAAASAGAVVGLGGFAHRGWGTAPPPIWPVAAVLGAGFVGALAAMLIPPLARALLEPLRAEAAARERAAVIFLERGLFATPGRTAVLLLACRFERRAVVRADTGFRGRVADAEWQAVEEAASTPLRAGLEAEALLAGLEALELLLVAKGCTAPAGGGNELSDRPLSGAGAP